VTAPQRLRVEHLDDAALGIGDRRPRLSWQLPDGATGQRAYRIELDGRALDTMESGDSVLVPWAGDALVSRQPVEWRVKVWTDRGESEWSRPAWFETSLLDAADWRARWIEPVEPERGETDPRPAYVLRRAFTLDARPPAARLYATAHGCYETFLNGHRVGEMELTPGFTSYWANLHVQTYDVGDPLIAGENVWEVVLSDGWYRGRTGFRQQRDCYGDTVAFLGQLHAGDLVIGTDDEWRSATGSILAADLMAGQTEDRRVEPRDWQPVTTADHDFTRLTASPAPPVRRVQELRPVSVARLDPRRQVVDLGQNINGWVRLTDLGPAGADITLVHGEALDPSGDVTQDHLTAAGAVDGAPLTLGQIDRVVAAGREGDVFEPRHTTHGFQYVRVEGHPHRLTPDDVTGVVVHTDLRRAGWFRCSDEGLNRFHDLAEWSFRDNACDIPTDCPQRERAGWTGDWQVFVATAAFLYDVAGFSLKWLRDLAADQRPDGCVTNFAPDPARPKALDARDGLWTYLQGSSGWGDAVVMVPWELWRAYGDAEVLAELWPSMVRWIDFAVASARTKRHPDRVAARPVAAPHEQYLWDGGFHWGEWLEPDADENPFHQIDQGHVATAFLHHSAALAARIGRMLAHDDEAARFDELAARALDAWRAEYVAVDGSLTPDTQANHVRALAFGLVPDGLRAQTATHLVELIRRADTHLGTGFLATPYLLPVLADTGHLDVAYDLLFQDTPPSWLAMVARGATTVWEDWDGIRDDGTPKASLNHYSKGVVISFLHTRVAGIQILDAHPGYRRFRIAPQPGGNLTWVEAVHDSPYGRIESSWRIDGSRFTLTTTVPPGTTAEIVLPDGTRVEQGPGTSVHETDLAAAP
jgi:alpha-L-rhamnosidase